MVTGIAGTAAVLVGLLGVAVLVALVAERIRVPSAVALVAFGAGTAAIHPVPLPFHFGDALLFIFLPPLIFEAAWAIDPAALRRTALRIVLLALPGVVLVAGSIGFGIALTGQLPLASAIVLGAIVSATDPVAVIGIFRRLHVPVDLLTIVEGESIANDGVAIVLYAIALAFAAGGAVTSLPAAIAHAIVAIAGGVAIGVAGAFVVAFVMGRTRSGPLEIAATVVLAFLTYLSADALHCSGVFATAAAGIALRAFAHIAPVTDHADDVDTFWNAIAFIVNAMVFLATGLVMQVGRIGDHPLLVVVAIDRRRRFARRARRVGDPSACVARDRDLRRDARRFVARARARPTGSAAVSRRDRRRGPRRRAVYVDRAGRSTRAGTATARISERQRRPVVVFVGCARGRRVGHDRPFLVPERDRHPQFRQIEAETGQVVGGARPAARFERRRLSFCGGAGIAVWAAAAGGTALFSCSSNGTTSLGSRKSSCSSRTVLANASAFGIIRLSLRLRPRTIDASISARTPLSGIPVIGTRL